MVHLRLLLVLVAKLANAKALLIADRLPSMPVVACRRISAKLNEEEEEEEEEVVVVVVVVVVVAEAARPLLPTLVGPRAVDAVVVAVAAAVAEKKMTPADLDKDLESYLNEDPNYATQKLDRELIDYNSGRATLVASASAETASAAAPAQ